MTRHPIRSLERKGAMRLEPEIRVKAGAGRPLHAMDRPAPRPSKADRGSQGESPSANTRVTPGWKIHSAHRRFI